MKESLWASPWGMEQGWEGEWCGNFIGGRGSKQGINSTSHCHLKKKNSCVESSLWGEGASLVASHELS